MTHVAGPPGPERTARCLAIAATVGLGYRDYFLWRAAGLNDNAGWSTILAGHALAPDQYRIGIVWLVHHVSLVLHIKQAHAMAALDALTLLGATLLQLNLVERSRTYREADIAAKWLAHAAVLLLTAWWLAWAFWPAKPETLPAALCVVSALWLLTPPDDASPPPSSWLHRTAWLLLTVALATFRADLAMALNFGLASRALAKPCPTGDPRTLPAALGLLGLALSATAQYWLARIAYPGATYGPVYLWQLRYNATDPTRWPPFAVFLLPLGWMLYQLWQRRAHRPAIDRAARAMLAAAALYAVLWVTVGKIDEVRIFVPMAMGLTPLTVQMLVRRVQESVTVTA